MTHPRRAGVPVDVRSTTFLLLVASLACHACDDFRDCPPIPAERLAALPPRLSMTGLFADPRTQTLAPGVRPFTPQFALWSDGATKRRWAWLPPGAVIDTSDMDAWQFPVGTKLWKEFTRDGVRVETRLLQKVGPAPADWAPMAYVWDPSGEDATAAVDGQEDALGTPHDVPSASACMGCHGGRPGRVLGFSAIQLAGDQLAALVREGLLSRPPARDPVVPGDDVARAALGYLHANCSHCHNRDRPPAHGGRCFDPRRGFEFLLRTDALGSVEQTPTYRTAVGGVIRRGDPSESEVIRRVRGRDRDLPSMPPLATEVVDATGVATLRAWIEQLR